MIMLAGSISMIFYIRHYFVFQLLTESGQTRDILCF